MKNDHYKVVNTVGRHDAENNPDDGPVFPDDAYPEKKKSNANLCNGRAGDVRELCDPPRLLEAVRHKVNVENLLHTFIEMTKFRTPFGSCIISLR